MATNTNFQNMLNEIVKAPNQSRAKKFLKLKRSGLTDDEANNLLDQYALFAESDTTTDTFLDSKYPKGVTDYRPLKAKKSKKLKL